MTDLISREKLVAELQHTHDTPAMGSVWRWGVARAMSVVLAQPRVEIKIWNDGVGEFIANG